MNRCQAIAIPYHCQALHDCLFIVTTAVKQGSLGLRERVFTRLTAVALHAFVGFAIFDDIALPDLSIVRTRFVPAERPDRCYCLLIHG